MRVQREMPSQATADRRRHPRRGRAALPAAIVLALLALPLTGTAGAGGSGETVKVGIIAPITGQSASNPDTGDAFEAAVAAFNKRGGVGVDGLEIEGIVCDSGADPNGEVECARQMVEDGVVATINDLTFNNASAVVEILEGAGIPRIGLGATGVDEFASEVSYPLSAGIVGGYVATAIGFEAAGATKVALVRTDSAAGGSFRGFISPPIESVGLEVVGDIALATGATDYAPYVAEIQNTGADAALLAIDDAAAAQLIAAMQQLNLEVLMGGVPGTFNLETLREFKDLTKGTITPDSFPYPTKNNAKAFPGLKQYFSDMKAAGKSNLKPANLVPNSFYPWIALLAFVNMTADLDTFTSETVTEVLETVQDIDLHGLTPPWTPSTPGFSLFESTSNHFVYLAEFDGKNVVSDTEPVDVSQHFE